MLLTGTHPTEHDTPTSKQLNLRLSPADHDKLAAHAFIGRTTTTELVREIVAAWLAIHGSDAGVDTVLRGLAEADDAGSPPGQVQQLRPDRKTGR